MAGFYRSSSKCEESAESKFIVATQFEATDARRAFPCWDEPSVKATFSISLAIPRSDDLVALSNMNLVDRQIDGDLHVYRFAKSPLMSTYLVAWVAGELTDWSRVEKTSGGVEVRVWAPKGTPAESGAFARTVAAKTLDFFAEYFDLPYPLPKMDMVALPDFAAGAMENWGLVTYRTVYLLFDPDNSSLKTKQQVAYVVGHELAHQWFGNLVTMEWWSDLWLNEGFATWVGWLAADKLFPEWDIWTEFVVDDCQAGLALDCLRSSHPIEVPVRNPSEISQIFDSISYSKGASIIRMLVAFLGEETFKRGIQAYLKRYVHGNARTEDLWTSLSEASGQPVNKIMGGWTRVIGYPVISVQVDRDTMVVSQARFLSSGDVREDEDQFIWSVPLFPAAKDSSHVLLSERTSSFPLSQKLNIGQAGFYRVNYPTDMWEKLAVLVKTGQVTNASDRIGLLSDLHSMSVAGTVGLTVLLDFIVGFSKEHDYFVWNELISRLASVSALFWQDSEALKHLDQLMVKLTEAIYAELAFDFGEHDSDKTKLLRQLVIAAAGKAGNAKVIDEAKRRFARYVGGEKTAIHPNLLGTVYSISVREGGASEFDSVFNLYNVLTVPDQKLAALAALGTTRHTDLLKRALALTLDVSVVRPQDIIYVFRSVGANRHGRQLCWSFVKEHWPVFYERYEKGGFSLLSRIVTSSTDGFTRPSDADDIEAFFSERKEAVNINRAIEQTLERIRTNSKWLDRNKDQVNKWLIGKLPLIFK